jgi:hypothetical protein
MSHSFRFEITEKVCLFCKFYNTSAVIFFNNDDIKVLFKRNKNLDNKILILAKQSIEQNKYNCTEKYTVQIEAGKVFSSIRGKLDSEEYNEICNKVFS